MYPQGPNHETLVYDVTRLLWVISSTTWLWTTRSVHIYNDNDCSISLSPTETGKSTLNCKLTIEQFESMFKNWRT